MSNKRIASFLIKRRLYFNLEQQLAKKKMLAKNLCYWQSKYGKVRHFIKFITFSRKII